MHRPRAMVAAALCVAVFLTAFSGAAAAEGRRAVWPMYRGDLQRTGQSPFRGPAPMRVAWKVDLKHEVCTSPSVAPDGTIYVGAGASTCAISPEGRVLWCHDFVASKHARTDGSANGPRQAFTSPTPAIASDGTIYQACGLHGQGYVVAMDPGAGGDRRIRWTFKTGEEMRSSPLVVGASCFVGRRTERMVLALDASGKPKWPAGAATLYAVTSSPALSPNAVTLYIGGSDGRLHALDSATGRRKWSAGPEANGRIKLPEKDAQGKVVRRFTTAGHVPEAPAVGLDGTIYFGSWDGHLYAASPNGQVRWAVDLKDRVTSAPAVSADGRVLVSTFEGTLYCVREGRDPAIEWQAEANARYSAPLVSADGKVYVGTMDGRLRCFALRSGSLLDELACEGWIHASPVPGGDGRLYVGASDGFLRAVEGANGLRTTATGAPRAAARAPQQEKPAAGSSIRDVSARVVPALYNASPALRYDEAVRLAQAYMGEEDAGRREEILRKIGAWSERLDEIAIALRPVPPAGAPTGYFPAEKFTLPRLRARMQRLLPCAEGPVRLNKDKKFQPAPGEEYLNWVYVPAEYRPGRPMGMVLQLHGGAGGSRQSAAAAYLESQGFVMMDLLRGHEFITVCPGTPPMAPSKWSFPESETHLQAIIEEYSTRYHIDPDRIYLMGGSMGGIGCWWHAFREPDRFALIAPMAGVWQTACWERLRGTLLYLVSGAFDHHTHVDFHRYAHRRMTELELAHFDAEYVGAHSRTHGRRQIEALFELIRITRRDPYAPRVCAISPFVVSDPQRFPRQPHTFWASVLEAGPEGVLVERAARNANKTFAPKREWMKAGQIDAENLGANRFRVKAANVKRFALWLHPKMGVDFSKPIEIEVLLMGVDPDTKTEFQRGRQTVTARAQPALGAMLRYLGDRRDYGLIYHAAVEVALAEADPP